MQSDPAKVPVSPTEFLAFYGHHKCATMTLNAIIGAVCKRIGFRFEAVFDEDRFAHDLQHYIRARKIDFIAYGNADIEYVKQLPPHRGFHIIRDPRDIVVSAYFSHLYSHSTSEWQQLENHREKLKTMPLDEGLMEEIRFRGRSFRHMQTWDYGQPHILEIRFEDFIRSNFDVLIGVFEFLGLLDRASFTVRDRLMSVYRTFAAYAGRQLNTTLPARPGPKRILVPELLTITWRNSFQFRASGRKAGEEDAKSHYRKGKSGDWQDYFKDSHRDLFKTLYPGLVPKLEYHPDDNW